MKYTLAPLLFIISFISSGQNNVPTPDDVRNLIAKSILDIKVTPEPVAQIKNEFVINGKDSIAIRIYQPSTTEELPVVYMVHGGGFVAGDLDTHDNICRYLANKLHALVVAVNYRRPPEHKFPAAFDDSYFIFKWIYAHLKTLMGNGIYILMGDSAGGQIVSAICISNSKEKVPIPLSAQVLVNPTLDLSKNSVSYSTYPLFVDWYLNESDNAADFRISPLLAKDFSKLPPAIIVVGESDEIRNDGEAYNKKLIGSGIRSSIFIQPGMGHLGEAWCAADEKAKLAMDFVVEKIKQLYQK